jgi:hypothetical protein
VLGKRDSAGPIGLGLTGSWVRLEPATEINAAELVRFDRGRELSPFMGAGGRSGSSHFAPQMLIRDLGSGEAVGVVDNHELPGGIAVFVLYLDSPLGRSGRGWEAVVLYISCLFDGGARLVTAEVLEFNSAMTAILRKVGLEIQARLREHVYTAGRYWDLLVYSFDRDRWLQIISRYERILPGGDRRPAALGVGSPKTSPAR